MLISPSAELGNRVEHLNDGYWHVKKEFLNSWTESDQKLLDSCNQMLKDYRSDRSKFVFDEDID